MLEKCYTIKDNTRFFEFKDCVRFLAAEGKRSFPSFNIYKDDLKLIYKLLCYAICDEDECKKLSLDLDKGILLTGPVGCGKTSLMTLLNQFCCPAKKYRVKGTREIAAEFNKEGFEIIQKYGHKNKVICLDDLGLEQNMKHYGNECNTIGEILLHRHDIFVTSGTLTHATTNLNAEELENIYGNRVRSRMREMFNLISFPHTTPDKRK
jgi:DNA replication protein DnaC